MLSDAPFSPLVNGGSGLERAPSPALALRRRMAAVYGVAAEQVLAVRGAAHGIALVKQVAPEAVVVSSPDAESGVSITQDNIRAKARALAPSPLVVDERLVEFSNGPSVTALLEETPNLIVLRSLEIAYGLAGAPCAAVIAAPELIARLSQVCEAAPLATPVVRLAEAVLDATRAVAQAARVADVKAERTRVALALRSSEIAADAADGPFIVSRPDAETRARLVAFGVAGEAMHDGVFRLDIRDRAANDRALAAFGIGLQANARRFAEVIRETAETRIVARIDLEASGPVAVDTGVAFYDHMLTQVAVHGGFSLTLTCAGDLRVDAHHTIEDCALAFGQALSQALAERRGIARFGFVLPMDEAQAHVAIDLGGRPYLVFEGVFSAPLIGAYPVEMTEHVFRSLAQSLGAAIHLTVTGDNDHHKTEACYKAFGRALRGALRVESDVVPSSKGVIA